MKKLKVSIEQHCTEKAKRERERMAKLPARLKSASVSEDSSMGERKGRRFLRRKRAKEKALAATVRVAKTPASFAAETNSGKTAIEEGETLTV